MSGNHISFAVSHAGGAVVYRVDGKTVSLATYRRFERDCSRFDCLETISTPSGYTYFKEGYIK